MISSISCAWVPSVYIAGLKALYDWLSECIYFTDTNNLQLLLIFPHVVSVDEWKNAVEGIFQVSFQGNRPGMQVEEEVCNQFWHTLILECILFKQLFGSKAYEFVWS